MVERSKDVMITSKSTSVSKDKAGRDRYQYSFSQEQATVLYTELGAMLTNPNGVKLDLHTGEKTTNDGSRTFLSTFGFIKAIEAAPAGAAYGAPRTFAPKAVPTASKVAAETLVKNATLKG